MALKRNERYPSRFANPSTAHPQGAFQNRTSPTSQDGSYMEADWANDWSGFFERLLTVAGQSPNGNVDNATTSQYFDALIQAVKNNLGTAALANIGTGASQVPDMNSFQSLKSSIGYQKMPGGLIFQWGIATGTTGNLAGNYAIAFPNGILQAVATLADKTASTNNGISVFINANSLLSKTTMTVIPTGTDGLGVTTAHFFAIGY